MVDIHSHILPGLDDGAETLDESLEMLKIAAESGTTDIVATPHANLDFDFDAEIIETKLAELRAANSTGVNIHAGCDFHLDYDLVQDALAHPRKYTINHGPYLMVELPEMFLTRTVPPILESLTGCGIIPILTHPERYYALQGKIDDVKEWVTMGCLVQVTGQSLLGVFGSTARKTAERLLDAGIVHFMASDAHHAAGRTPRLTEARSLVVRRCGEAVAQQLFETNPRATLIGEPLPPAEPCAPKPRRWFSFWN